MGSMKDILKKNYLVKRLINIRNERRVNAAYKLSRKYIKSDDIAALKNSQNAKRCFIIGNGPSLTLEDLEMLKNEDCFAANSIYKLFDKTMWRPTYYVSQDIKVLDDLSGDLGFISDSCKYVFLNSGVCERYPDVFKRNNVYAFFVNTFDDDIHFPGFSYDIVKEIDEGYTVTYGCIQMAVYMGYSEIYILGCDHNYTATYAIDGRVRTDSTVNNNYMKLMDHKLINLPRLDKTTIAYAKARKACEEKGIIIKNATRGGKLEIFERINFDDLFNR